MKTNQFNKIFIIGLMLLFAMITVRANEGTVKGQVKNAENHPIEFATAVLLNSETNEIEKGVVCNENGEFIFEKVIPGKYTLSIRMLGYDSNETETLVISSNNQNIEKTIILHETNQQIKEVVVAARYAFVEQEVDKIVINPNASLTSSSESIYEILKKSPGVNIDNNDNITLKGMQGVTVMIDNKPTYLPGNQLAPLLKGMLGKNIKSIEIIENPSARYDAEGNAGIININTKHNKAPGFNGSINSGVTFTRTVGENVGADLNMNIGKLNVYGNFAFYDWKGWSEMNATRRFTSDLMSGAYQIMKNESTSDGMAHNYKTGADYYISSNHIISFMLRGSAGHDDMIDDGNTAFADKYKVVDSTLISLANRANIRDNQTFNFNYKWDIDSTGRSLTVDADYARFFYNGESDQRSKFYDIFHIDMDQDLTLNSDLRNNIDILSAKIDYSHPITKNYSLEAGLKNSFVKTDSKASMLGYYDQNDRFIYEENIQAAYASGQAQFERTSVQVGLRLENTISTGNSVSTARVDKKNYLEVFPSVFIQQNLKPDQTIGLRYSYRIGRPGYHYLNPFVWIIDPYTYNLGNPGLKPQFTHSLALNHSYKGKIMTSLGYNHTKDLYTQLISQDDETKAIYQTMENFGQSIDFNLTETIQLQPAKWWRFSTNVSGMYKQLTRSESGNFGFKRWSYFGTMSNSFTLPYKIGVELSGNYMSKHLVGNFTIKPRYSIDLGMQIRIMNEKGSIRASLSDILNTSSAGAYSKYGNIDIDANNRFETQRLNISFNYRFGNNDFRTRANRSTSSTEEERRSSR
jgi:hypothetical protein